MSELDRQKMGKHAKEKGKVGERRWCRLLEQLFPLYDPWYRNLGINGKQPAGDLCSETENPYYVEVKSYKSVKYHLLLMWQREAKLRALQANKQTVLLCVKADGFPHVIITDQDMGSVVRDKAESLGILLIVMTGAKDGHV